MKVLYVGDVMPQSSDLRKMKSPPLQDTRATPFELLGSAEHTSSGLVVSHNSLKCAVCERNHYGESCTHMTLWNHGTYRTNGAGVYDLNLTTEKLLNYMVSAPPLRMASHMPKNSVTTKAFTRLRSGSKDWRKFYKNLKRETAIGVDLDV